MRIPPSVFVMSIVTAVPFSLAVKDTLHPPKTRAQIEEEKERQYEADMEAQAQADRQAEEAAAKAKKAKLGNYLGGNPAKLGPWFGTVHLGVAADDGEIDALEAKDSGVGFVRRGGQVSAITIAADDNCEDLHDAVIAAWQSAPDDVYFDAETHQRAQFHDCTLTFDHYLDVDSWVDRKADAPVSLSLVGMSADKLRTTLGDKIDSDDGNSLTWYVPGIGRSSLPTEIVANIELNKIVSVHVDVATDQNTADLVRDRLTTLLGTPKVDPDTEIATWNGKTTVTLQAGYGDLTLEIGK